jgi:uncharacterized membrane protein
MKLTPKIIIHDSFRLGIFVKGFDGIVEIIGAVLILFITPAILNQWVKTLTVYELGSDPKDFLANHLIQFSQNYSLHTQWFGALYLASHGIIKIFLVISLWQKRLWAYPTAIIVFSVFGIYQMYRFNNTHSIGLLVLTILDVFVIILTLLEYRQLKTSMSP